jgi:hypothetical protein
MIRRSDRVVSKFTYCMTKKINSHLLIILCVESWNEHFSQGPLSLKPIVRSLRLCFTVPI